MELSLGRRVKAAPKKIWMDTQRRMKKIVETYEKYRVAQCVEYLQKIGCNIVISVKLINATILKKFFGEHKISFCSQT